MKKVDSAVIARGSSLPVEVEVSFTKGLPGFSIVGLASSSVMEARDRVKAALASNGFVFPPKKIVINLFPSDIQKSGTMLDLPIAVGIALYDKEVDLGSFLLLGELGLDGRLRNSDLLYPVILGLLKDEKIKNIIAPKEAEEKLSLIPSINLYTFETLKEVLEFFVQKEKKSPIKQASIESRHIVCGEEKYYYEEDYREDFFEVRGQEVAKRAAVIAAAGFHNLIMEGNPGSGKSMIAKRLRYVLPPLGESEILEIAALQSLEGREPDFRAVRPFRVLNQNITKSALLGGGSGLDGKPGELANANLGLAFFDEISQFQKAIIESLREPLEDSKLLVSRVNTKIEYATKFMFVAAQNPCPCGNLFSTQKECRCTEAEIDRYRSKLSEPIMDRIDLYVKMDEVTPESKPSLTSKEIHTRVREAFVFRLRRGQREFNGKLSGAMIEKFCVLEKEAEAVLESAVARFALSFRSVDKLKKVSRTIADIEASDRIQKPHLLEALGFRQR